MKAAYAIGVGASLLMVSAGTWLGCSSSNAPVLDAGPGDAAKSSSGGGDSGATSSSGGGSSGGGSSGGTSSSGGGGSSSSSGGGSSSSSSSSGGAPLDAGALTWAQVYSDVISGYCADCHGRLPTADGGVRGGLRVGRLNLSSADAGYSGLIGVPAEGTAVPAVGYGDAGICRNLADAGGSGSVRVVPGDANSSLLYLKVHGFTVPPPCGAPMPEPTPGPGMITDGGGQDLAAAEIMNWINQGALP